MVVFVLLDLCCSYALSYYHVNRQIAYIFINVRYVHVFKTINTFFYSVVDEARNTKKILRLSDWYEHAGDIVEDDNFDGLVRGMVTQPEKNTDHNYDDEIKSYFGRFGKSYGDDLFTTDIHRNRYHGLASYNSYREYCGLSKATSFDGFADLIAREDVDKLKLLYASHEDVDLFIGGSLETHVDNALAGPTFLCIITEQFLRSRKGDRFFYENGSNKQTSFSPGINFFFVYII